MAFAEIELARISKIVGEFCERRVPAYIRDKLRLDYSVEGHDVVVFEVRPRWDNPGEHTQTPVAKIRFVRTANEWRLFWMRGNLKWNSYEPFPASRDLAEIMNVIDRDELCCFFG